MVEGIWIKVPTLPSINTTLTAYTELHAKALTTCRHCRQMGCVTLTTANTIAIRTQMDSYTMLFRTPIHIHIMALTTRLSCRPMLRIQTHSQTHSSKILTFSYRLALPRAAASRRRFMSALTRCRKLPSRTTMHSCPPFMSILTRIQLVANRHSKTFLFPLPMQPIITLHKSNTA